jgi:hypothetical protein
MKTLPLVLLSLGALLGCQTIPEITVLDGASPSAPFSTLPEADRLEAGILKIVDPKPVSETSVWTHTVMESGDYQLGMAWVELVSGESVELSIRSNGDTVRSLEARRSGEPTRFETRIEALNAGDRIEVRAEPKDGAIYRLAFHLAIATPTFSNLEVFHVGDFGAIGDGETDDLPAIHQTVATAIEAGGGIIRFEGDRTYRVIGKDDLIRESVFPLQDARNIKVEGQGARLILHPPDGLAEIRGARNIHIDGLSIDYDPLPYYQGNITDIDMERMTIDLEVHERYPVPLTGRNQHHQPFFGRSFTPHAPGSRAGSGHNIYVDLVERIGNEREIRLHLPGSALGSDTPDAAMRPRLQYAKDTGATEFVVPHLLYGHLHGETFVHTSSRVMLSNLNWSVVPYFWLDTRDNIGPVTFRNVNLKASEPETELLVSWRDGMHIKNSRFGMLIEDCDIDGAAMYDDIFAIYTRVHRVIEIDGKTVRLKPAFRDHKDIDTWWPGDWVSIWNQDQSELRGMSRLVTVQDVVDENQFYLTLEFLPDGTQADDTFINEELLNRNTLIRNCRTSDLGTGDATTRFRASDILFENNHFEEFSFTVEFNPFWGTPRSRNVVVKDTYIASHGGRVALQWPIGVSFENVRFHKTQLTASRNAKDIRLKDVEWTEPPEKFLHVGAGSELWIYGRSLVDGSLLERNSSAFTSGTLLNPDSNIHFEAPPK